MRTLGVLLVVALTGWVVLLVAAPVALASSSRVEVASAAAAYTAGGLVCHQQGARSFAIAGRQMPVCARCTGLYVSALLGGIVALGGRRRRIAAGARWALAAAAVPTAISWGLDYTGLTHTSNALRFVLGLPLGIVGGWAVISLTRERG